MGLIIYMFIVEIKDHNSRHDNDYDHDHEYDYNNVHSYGPDHNDDHDHPYINFATVPCLNVWMYVRLSHFLFLQYLHKSLMDLHKIFRQDLH